MSPPAFSVLALRKVESYLYTRRDHIEHHITQWQTPPSFPFCHHFVYNHDVLHKWCESSACYDNHVSLQIDECWVFFWEERHVELVET
jgi:hypothetical protein